MGSIQYQNRTHFAPKLRIKINYQISVLNIQKLLIVIKRGTVKYFS
jgi:hypothetical protein